ncbi:hypothetical protein HRI_000748100 [Hibiscus trionum]|uniref:Uncharacterized protein n=1 Tax=Hibiscus trionum TaxID=183268 RepID=A0A9W7LN68_HIBTR|nr:hypothetical protein HRI_000748100 [Hibiscus trionum]
MGLSNLPSSNEGVLSVLVMNTVLSVAMLKNTVRSLLQVLGATRFKCLCHHRWSPSCEGGSVPESEVCLSGFEADEEVISSTKVAWRNDLGTNTALVLSDDLSTRINGNLGSNLI